MQIPNLLGRSLTLNNVVSSPANCQGSMGQGVVVGDGRGDTTHRVTGTFSSQNQHYNWPWQAPSNIHFLDELGD